mmetsp:Transcript_30654/g.56014  ORF Transcript_30654/g.56014 Transcript_30654/m.56014 type:complete len:271 (-) Transcript_30654:60-872(-)
MFSCCSKNNARGYEKVADEAAGKDKPSDTCRKASRLVERIVIAVLFLFILISAVALIVATYHAYESSEFKDADDSMAYQMKLSNNPFKVSYVTYALALCAAIAVVTLVVGLYAILRGGKCCNMCLVITLTVVTLLMLALTVVLFVFLKVYGTSAMKSKNSMCDSIEALGGCSAETLPSWISKACSIMKSLLSFCNDPCSFVDDMCGGSFDHGMDIAWAILHCAWVCTLNLLLVSMVSCCFLFELMRNSSILDKLDVCRCLDKYDAARGSK